MQMLAQRGFAFGLLGFLHLVNRYGVSVKTDNCVGFV